jgi:putative oxidoreductase
MLGATMIAHGVRHGRTLDGTTRWFDSIGFRQARAQAAVSSALEVASGAALVAGFGTPLAASAVVGTMAVAGHTVHRPNGFFVVDEGWEYVALVAAAAAALAGLGSGRFSVDHAVGLDRWGSPTRRAVFALALGVGGAAAHLRAFWSAPDGRRPGGAS